MSSSDDLFQIVQMVGNKYFVPYQTNATRRVSAFDTYNRAVGVLKREFKYRGKIPDNIKILRLTPTEMMDITQ